MRLEQIQRIALPAFLAVLVGATMALASEGGAPVKPASGETVHLDIGTLPAGKKVTVTYDVTVDSPFPTGVTEVSNQGTVSGTDFPNISTDDPDVAGSADPTVTGIVNNDIGVIAINAPATGCGLGAAEVVTITIANFTSQPQTGFDVKFEVTGPTHTGPVTENVGALTVPGNGTASYSFSTTADLSTPGDYAVSASTALVGDGDTSNDGTTSDVSSLAQVFADAGSDITICPGSSTQIGGSPTGSGGTGTLTYAWTPTAGLDDPSLANPTATPAATTKYTVLVTAENGCTATADVTVTVEDVTPPVITLASGPEVLWPPDHKYRTVSVLDCVASVSDNCDTSLKPSDVVITSVTSDEPEDGDNDGNTLNDIVIARDCGSVNLRAERQGSGADGRVYTIHLSLTDANGVVGTALCTVIVPPNQGDVTAGDDGPHYTVSSSCGAGLVASGTHDIEPDPMQPIALPDRVVLSQSFPNPFDLGTTIRFALPRTGTVTLNVYTLTGQRVRVLADGEFGPGDHSVAWNGTDQSGRRVPSGVYLYQLRTEGVTLTRKTIVTQ